MSCLSCTFEVKAKVFILKPIGFFIAIFFEIKKGNTEKLVPVFPSVQLTTYSLLLVNEIDAVTGLSVCLSTVDGVTYLTLFDGLNCVRVSENVSHCSTEVRRKVHESLVLSVNNDR